MPFPKLRLPAAGWKRWLALLIATVGGLFLLLVMLGLSLWGAFQLPAFQGWFFATMMQMTPPATPEETPGLPGVVPVYAGPVGDAAQVRLAGDIYRPSNIWNVHLKFSAAEWEAIQHRQIDRVPGWMNPDGSVTLRNPLASRNGLAGVLGIDFPWSTGAVEFGGATFTNVGIRFKGNGTYLGAMRSYRKSFKVQLDREAKKQSLGGRTIFNLGNLSADFTCLSDALAYEFFRDVGVPSPRTAFSRVFLSIAGTETNRLLGTFVMVENPDGEWAGEVFGIPGVALFKPVTLELFSDLGTNWADYDGIYDPKTKISPEQQQRVMEMARWVTHASDADFAAQVDSYVDVDEFARFLAAEVLLSNYDGILCNGQNFLFYLDPRTRKIGFIPWDLDHSWGEFPFLGTAAQREQASIWQPWVGTNRFLERMLSVPAVKDRYLGELRRMLDTVFVPERINRRLDEVAVAVRPVIAEWSTNRLARFDSAVSSTIAPNPEEGGNPMDPNRPAWQIKRFVEVRSANVKDQLEGRAKGVIITRQQK